ncbi:hypothetical protein EXH51_25285 [Pelomonas saccharophila]|nr:hypothetical protein [Roseateles saccharophilus]
MPLQACTTDQEPVGMMNWFPSRNTGTPVARSATTVKSAVRSTSQGVMKSPKGTAKNRKPSGKAMRRAASVPSSAGTMTTSMPTSVNCVAEFAAARSPTSHNRPSGSISHSQRGAGCGTSTTRSARRRQTSQAEIGGTTQAWAKVSERFQMKTMAAPVS